MGPESTEIDRVLNPARSIFKSPAILKMESMVSAWLSIRPRSRRFFNFTAGLQSLRLVIAGLSWLNWTLYGWLRLNKSKAAYGGCFGKFGVRLKWVSLIDTFPSLVSSVFQPSINAVAAYMRGFVYKQTLTNGNNNNTISFDATEYW